MKSFKRIIISRTDSIGDVVLTLPVAGMLKKKLPATEIIFMGRSYTRAVAEACEHIDGFIDWDSLGSMDGQEAVNALRQHGTDAILHIFPRSGIARLSKKARIPYRLGTTNRLYHLHTCNRLVRLSRRRSGLHEAQLNLKLVERITGEGTLVPESITNLYGLSKIEPLLPEFRALIDEHRINLILHPKSKGSAREWGLDNFNSLAALLPADKYRIFISGTEAEGQLMNDSGIFDHAHVHNLAGRMNLAQLLAFISACDGLVAASTGPLHLAAALGKMAIGIYPPIRPMHPGRWAPIGKKAAFLVADKECDKCRKEGPCECMLQIRPEQVRDRIEDMSD